MKPLVWMVCFLAGPLLAGCVLEPGDSGAQRARADKAGQKYQADFAHRSLPDLPAQPSWQDVLRRAFLANGELEAAYFEWKAAVSQIRGAGEWPNSGLMSGYSYFWSDQNVKGWNRSTLFGGSDPSVNVVLPQKTAQAAKVAYDDARAKAQRFAAAKFALQEKVLSAYYDYSLTGEKIRIQAENVQLFKIISGSAAQRVQTGGAQEDLLKAQTEYDLALNELENLKVELASQRASLNAMLARPPNAPLEPLAELPAPRMTPGGEEKLIAAAVENNPELAALAADIQGRSDSLGLAEMGYLPEFTVSFNVQGDVQQTLTGALMLPTRVNRIQSDIQSARADLRRSQALSRQGRQDKAAQFASALYGFRNSGRQMEVFTKWILPKAQQTWQNSISGYSSGSTGFVALLENGRTLLQVRLLIAEAAMNREKKLTELEALAGVDLESLGEPVAPAAATMPAGGPCSQPASQPATQPASQP